MYKSTLYTIVMIYLLCQERYCLCVEILISYSESMIVDIIYKYSSCPPFKRPPHMVHKVHGLSSFIRGENNNEADIGA